MQDFFLGRGRTSRLTAFITWVMISFSMYTLVAMSLSTDPLTGEVTMGFLGWIALAAATWANTANLIRRAHDINRPGVYVLLLFIPLVNIIIWLQLMFEPGTHGPNKHGIAAGTGSHQPGDMNEQIQRTHDQAVASHGAEPEYLNEDGSFNMDGLFQNAPR